MVQVKFGDVWSWDDLDMFLEKATISKAKPKRETGSIPGMHGNLDYTLSISNDVYFENRTLSLVFSVADYSKNWMNKFSRINNAIHGKRCRVIIDNEPDYYYEAFCTVEDMDSEGNKGKVRVDCDVYPFKRRFRQYIVPATEEGTTIRCYSGREPVKPTLVTTTVTVVTFNGETFSVPSGTHQDDLLKFTEGWNEITIRGPDSLATIQYLEGIL